MRDDPLIPTLREIAQAAGVSAVTVSRILRGHPKHSAKTSRRIKKIAEKMGWKPNPLVSALMSQRVRQHGTRTAANLVLLDPRSDMPDANANHISGATTQAVLLGYQIETLPYQPALISPPRLRRILMNRGVRGVILMPLPPFVGGIDFDFTGFASATIGYSLPAPNLPRVANDHHNSIYEAFSILEGRGYKRVGLIMADDANRRSLFLYPGACSTYGRFASAGMEIRDLILPNENFSREQRDVISSWIRENRLQAVLSSAYRMYEVLLEEGWSIPEQIAYLHLHRHHMETVSGMDQLRDYQGQKAVDLITGMIHRNESFPRAYAQTVLTPSQWREGHTVPSLSERAPAR